MDEPIEIGCTSLVGLMTQKALVQINIGETKVQISPEEARDVALNILACACAAEADLFLMTFATTRIGIAVNRSAQLLNEFRKWRENRDYIIEDIQEEN